VASWSALISRLKKATAAPTESLVAMPSAWIAPQPVGRIEGDVGDERGLAHARAAGEDDEVRIVQPADLLVHRGKAGGLARDVAARKQRLLDHFQRGARGHAEALRLVAGLRPFGHGIERGFGAFDLFERGYRIAGVARAFHQVAAHRHQFAQQREVIDLLGQFARGEQALPVRRQPGEIGGAAQFLQPFVAFEIGLERDRRDHRLAIDQRQDAFIDAAVDRREEMLGLQRGGEFLQNPVVDQHRAQKRGFRLDVGGECDLFRFAQEDRFACRHDTPMAQGDRSPQDAVWPDCRLNLPTAVDCANLLPRLAASAK
jgi:hypothetical protein